MNNESFIKQMRQSMLGEGFVKQQQEEAEVIAESSKYDALRDIFATMDKNDPLYDDLKRILDGVKTVSVSVTKPNAVKTKRAKEPEQQKPIINNGNPLEVGDILNDWFSYTMTFNRFYQVTGIKSKTVYARPIESKWVSGDGWTGQVVPVPNSFKGEETTFKLRGNFAKKEDVSIKSGRSGRVYYVAPKPDGTYASHYENHMD